MAEGTHQPMIIRPFTRAEIRTIWEIDRREVIKHVYYLRDGKLILEPEHFDMQGWPPGEAEHYTPILLDCFDCGGFFWGAFENERLVGACVLESRFIGSQLDTLQIKFLHVSRDFRKNGLGKRLFDLAADKARQMGAKKMYISATPSENTINFYLRRGCTLAEEIDPELYSLEPEDIHLQFILSSWACT
jgi:predicted N-acetyltransferase YhbS